MFFDHFLGVKSRMYGPDEIEPTTLGGLSMLLGTIAFMVLSCAVAIMIGFGQFDYRFFYLPAILLVGVGFIAFDIIKLIWDTIVYEHWYGFLTKYTSHSENIGSIPLYAVCTGLSGSVALIVVTIHGLLLSIPWITITLTLLIGGFLFAAYYAKLKQKEKENV